MVNCDNNYMLNNVCIKHTRIYRVSQTVRYFLSVLKTHLTGERTGAQSGGCPAHPTQQSWDTESEPRSPDTPSLVLSSPQLPPCYAKLRELCRLRT